ncbi:LuxR C-terminal-related transcriptional regulator [Dactylosporangium darangshiense]|uniref:LuxR C-terminal-related transcriptional regulator n=1 Tax=Dactylosporangium darangshiense TaxID=579108 RepID=A0ABP8D4M3_9ACTN
MGQKTLVDTITRPALHFAVPEPPRYHVPRPRLLDALDRAVAGPLTLISAPAGWGKTTLLAEWVAAGRVPWPLAWLTVEAHHGPRFWEHVLDAVTQVTGEAPVEVDGGEGPGEALEQLVTLLRRAGPPVVLVMDDLQELSVPRVWGELETLLSQAGERLRLVIACRTDPALTLYRFRIRGALSELRTGPLGFTLDETAQMLNAHGVRLAESALVELHAVMKGWAAGLRLAALAVQGHPEPDSLVPRFALQDRALGEYLVGEVFDTLPEDVREVVLCTSVLDQVSAELVEALTGRVDGARILGQLEHSNLFVVQGSGNAGMYRCHPLFGLMLYDELRHRRPEQVRQLHRRAADWFAAHDLPADALRHALAARNWSQASDLLAASWQELVPGARMRTIKELVPPPPQEVRNDPKLALAFAAERLDASDPQGTETFLHLVDRSQHTLVDSARAALRPIVDSFRMAEAHQSQKPELVLATAPLLLREDTGLDDQDAARMRALALVAVGGARLIQGDLAAAEHALQESLNLARRCGGVQSQLAALRQLAQLNATRGRLTAAMRYGKETLALADREGQTQGSDVVWAQLTVAEVCYLQARVRAAEHYLDRALDGGGLADPALVATATMTRAHIRAAAGDARAACTELAAIRRQLADWRYTPRMQHCVTLAEAELRLAAGDVEAAKRLLSLEPVEMLAPWLGVVRAKAHLAERRPAAALGAVQPYLEPTTGSLVWTVDANLTSARALRALGDRSKAGRALEQALRFADDETIRWPFVAGGQPVRELLVTYLPAGSGYRGLAEDIAQELTGFGRPAAAAGELAEPLTERELAVLRYLQGTLSAGEIASMLYVSVNTVKTHMKNIYRKLGVGRRREVIERARELNLL